MNSKPPLKVPAFVGSPPSPPSPLCFPSPKSEKREPSTLCGCQRAPKSHCISAIGVLVLVVAYTAMGSILFMTIEGEDDDIGSEETAVAASKPYPRTDIANSDIRSRTVDRLWSITEDLNILYKENWTRLAAREVQQFQDALLRAVRDTKVQLTGTTQPTKQHKWSYASSFLYSLTLITTIGYGGVAPRTQWGKLASIIYALFGIPIVLLYLSVMGEGLSSGMRCIFRRLRISGSNSRCCKGSSHSSDNASNSSSSGAGNGSNSLSVSGTSLNEKRPQGFPIKYNRRPPSPSIPISICVMILIFYMSLGALLFNKLQQWSVLESLYFCFTSLGTIGFGELTPTGNISQYASAAYILVGMAVVAMCFSLIQTELIRWMRRFGVHEQMPSPVEDVALVSVPVTPKS